jgi:murein lipoprotein
MRNTLLFSTILSLLLLGGCQATAPIQSEAPAPTAPKAVEAPKPALSDEAKQALATAEADIKEASNQRALWTTAEDALKKAKEAAAKGDSAATLKFAKTASEHAKLGLKQKTHPSTK